MSAVFVLFVVMPASAQTPVCSYQVVAAYPHDDGAFTQGLVFHEGELIEGTGLYGSSSLRRVELLTGAVQQGIALDDEYFGEGVAVWQDRIIQLTWLEQTAFVWNAETFVFEESFAYSGEGWGLTHDGRRLIMSNGSSRLVFRDPETFAEVGEIQVFDEDGPVNRLNELEWIRGEIFANRWATDRIARIDPATGRVIAWIDLAGLLDPHPSGADVLNGIAWDDAGERLFVTGKLWPTVFEIELVDCPELGLFSDGFEAGTTQRWSKVVP